MCVPVCGTLVAPVAPSKKGANALYIGVWAPWHPFCEKSYTRVSARLRYEICIAAKTPVYLTLIHSYHLLTCAPVGAATEKTGYANMALNTFTGAKLAECAIHGCERLLIAVNSFPPSARGF